MGQSLDKDNYKDIGDEELLALTNAIKNRYGFDFTNYETKSLKRGFARLMFKNNMKSLLQLWSAILKNNDLFRACLDDLTVNLTELFRNPDTWEVIEKKVLDPMKHQQTIRIWHAGCSTGEEVYTMSRVLECKGLLPKTKLFATDISRQALGKAQKGWYSEVVMDKYRKTMYKCPRYGVIKDMFDLDAEGNGTIKSKYRPQIEFQYHNLVTDQPRGTYDVIFCRNVMIYFDDGLKRQVLQRLLSALSPSGFLILGYYDRMPDSCKELITEYDYMHKIYVMADPSTVSRSYMAQSRVKIDSKAFEPAKTY